MKKLLIISASIILLAAACNKKATVETPAPQPQTETQTTPEPEASKPADTTPAPDTSMDAKPPVKPAGQSYTMEEVAANNSASKCWVVVNGNVYDLTKWINQHPGGPDKILGICGTNATAAFTAQHSGQAEPQQMIATFKIGVLEQ